MKLSISSILIVEDEPPLAGLLQVLFSSDYACVMASSMAEALKQLKASSFALVLVDEGLPDGSGLVLLQFIKATAPKTAVIVMSGNSDEQSVEKAKQKGADDFIGKPFDLVHVRSVVELAIAQQVSTAA